MIKTKCPIFDEHQFIFDYADSEKTVYYCICGREQIEHEDSGTGA